MNHKGDLCLAPRKAQILKHPITSMHEQYPVKHFHPCSISMGKNGISRSFKAPFISLFYGLCFAVASAAIEWLVYMQGSHLIIFPSLIVYMLIGPFLALGLYDASWQIEKNHKPKLLTPLKQFVVMGYRNGVLLYYFVLQ